jgi:Ca-activated chloride channel family protein
LAAKEQVVIYTIGVGADPEERGVFGLLGFSPDIDLDEPTLTAIADATGGDYFRARNSEELLAIESTLDRLQPVAQKPTLARATQVLYPCPLSLALLLSALMVSRRLWPQQVQRWRHRLTRLRGQA